MQQQQITQTVRCAIRSMLTLILGLAAGVIGALCTPGQAHAQDEGSAWWFAVGSSTNGIVQALAVSGSELFIGGSFSSAGGVSVSNIARLNSTTNSWSALGSGVSGGWPTALAVAGSELYVGGNFTAAGGISVNRIARFNLTTQSWSALGSGTNGAVNALAVVGSDLYVVGDFTSAGGVSANRIARFNLTTQSWSALGSGVNGIVRAVVASGSELFVGGEFTTAGGVSANRIARFNLTTQNWAPLGSGVDSLVYALTLAGSELYVGGGFTTAGGVSANRIARFNLTTQSWSALGSGVNSTIYTIAMVGNDLYVGGMFNTAGGLSMRQIARFNTVSNSWSRLGSGISGTSIPTVNAFALIGTNLYVGGLFTTTGWIRNIAPRGIAGFSTTAPSNLWSDVGGGASDSVRTLQAVSSMLYAGGDFTTIGTLSANRIARFNTTNQAWGALGSGTNGSVRALALVGSSSLYVAGDFTTANGVVVDRIAHFNTTTDSWSALAGGGVTGGSGGSTIRALAVVGSDLYIGGNFTSAGGIATSHIARFNTLTNSWSALGSGLNGSVYALAVVGSDLYIGGEFTMASGVNASRVVRFNTLSNSWSALGSGVNNLVYAIEADSSSVYVGGSFSQAGGMPSSGVARFDIPTSSWHLLGTGTEGQSDLNSKQYHYTLQGGVNDTVFALELHRGNLYVGGNFWYVYGGSLTTSRIAKFDLTTNVWSAVGTGVNNSVLSITSLNDTIYGGGAFTTAGGITANRLARIYAAPDPYISMSGPANAILGSNVVYTLTYTNSGQELASGVQLTQILPTGYSFGSSSPMPTSTSGQVRSWNLGTLGPGATGQIIITATLSASAASHAELVATISTTTSGDSLHNNSACVATTAPSSTPSPFLPLACGTLGLDSSRVRKMLRYGSELYVSGEFTTAGNITARNIARFNPTSNSWSALGLGTNYGVQALAMVGPNLYVGGRFSMAGGSVAYGIARFNTSTNAWSALGSGVNGVVNALVAVGDELYVAGSFSMAGGISANGIARVNTVTGVWSALGSGVDGHVRALALMGNELYVGGLFTQADTLTAISLARFNTSTQRWSTPAPSLLAGTGQLINAFAMVGSDLYVGGNFGATVWSDTGNGANHIARLNTLTNSWHTLGVGRYDWSISGGVSDAVVALTILGDSLYVAGSFLSANSGLVATNCLARWSLTERNWMALGSGVNCTSGAPGRWIHDLFVADDQIYLGGSFTLAHGVSARNVARVTGLPEVGITLHGLTSSVVGQPIDYTISYSNTGSVGAEGVNLTYTIPGGYTFVTSIPAPSSTSGQLRSWNLGTLGPGAAGSVRVTVTATTGAQAVVGHESSITTSSVGDSSHNNRACVPALLVTSSSLGWSSLGCGATSSRSSTFIGSVQTIVSGSDRSSIYLGGDFSAIGGVGAANIVRLHPATQSWSALGSGTDHRVNRIVQLGDSIYLGGQFTVAGGLPASRIARLNITTGSWSTLGAGLNGTVTALAVIGNDLYVGGNFSSAGGVSASHIARFNTVTNSWSTLGSGTNGMVEALAVVGSDLYVGGAFTAAGGVAANYIARFNSVTNSWSALGSGVVSGGNSLVVRALAAVERILYVGGTFSSAGGVAQSAGIARFDTLSNSWSAMGGGVSGHVRSLVMGEDQLFVGGAISTAGGLTSSNIAAFAPSTSSWSILGSAGAQGAGSPCCDVVLTMASMDSTLYVGGTFPSVQSGQVAAVSVARWSSALPPPDVEVTISGSASLTAGATTTYVLNYRNTGLGTAQNVVVTSTLPVGIALVQSIPAPSSRAGLVRTWNLGSLQPGASGSITLHAQAATTFDPASVTSWEQRHEVSIGTSTLEALVDRTDNVAELRTLLQRPEVELLLSGPANLLVGDEASQTLTYRNSGSSVAEGVVVTYNIPTGFNLLSATPPVSSVSGQLLSWSLEPLAVGASGNINLRIVPTLGAAALTVSSATISTNSPGDRSENNSVMLTTAVQFPDPQITIRLAPSVSVGRTELLTLDYSNSGTGVARSSLLTVTLEAGVLLGSLPTNCQRADDAPVAAGAAPGPQLVCNLGNIAAGAAGSQTIPLRIPATPSDLANFPSDQLRVRAELATTTPELPETRANSTSLISCAVVRPNLYVRVRADRKSLAEAGDAGWLSYVRFTVEYGNDLASSSLPLALRRPRELTAPAEQVLLTVTLPAQSDLDRVELLNGTSFAPFTLGRDSQGDPALLIALNSLTPQLHDAIRVTVRVRENPGATLLLAATITTTTPGDEPLDNRAHDDTTIVAPPSTAPVATSSELRLAIHSTLDPRSGGSDQRDGVYFSTGSTIAWPAGEVLDFSPRLRNLIIRDPVTTLDPLAPYAYRVQIKGWSIANFNHAHHRPQGQRGGSPLRTTIDPRLGSDAKARSGCRQGWANLAPTTLTGCSYHYPGALNEGVDPSLDLADETSVTESVMAHQGHAYWTTQGGVGASLPSMRPDVYLFAVNTSHTTMIELQVEVEVWVVNLYPRAPIGDWTPDPVEVTSIPRQRLRLSETFTVRLVAPGAISLPRRP